MKLRYLAVLAGVAGLFVVGIYTASAAAFTVRVKGGGHCALGQRYWDNQPDENTMRIHYAVDVWRCSPAEAVQVHGTLTDTDTGAVVDGYSLDGRPPVHHVRKADETCTHGQPVVCDGYKGRTQVRVTLARGHWRRPHTNLCHRDGRELSCLFKTSEL